MQLTMREDPLRQGFGIAREACALKGKRWIFYIPAGAAPSTGAQQHQEPLDARGNIDAVVFGDVMDDVRGEFTGEGTDTHGGENSRAGGEVTPEGAA